MFQLHELSSPAGSRKRKKIVGRGRATGWGKTSGRGENGQKSRSTGRATVATSEGGQMPLTRRISKVGFINNNKIHYQIVNVKDLNCFEQGTTVNLKNLKSKSLISTIKKPVKILGKGELKKNLDVKITVLSKSAEEKILKAGGKVKKEKNKKKK